MKLTIAACAAAVALALGVSGAALAQSKGEVRLLTYEGYADPAWVKEFQDETGIAVKVTYVGGVDEQIAKMKASNGKDYDVVAVDTASLKAFADQKLVAPIDKSKFTSFDNLLPQFQPMANATFDNVTYGIPWAWGSLGLVYDKKTFPQAPTSWSVLWDPQYKGKVISLDDANNCVNFAAIALGIKDPFKLDDAQFAQVKQKLVDLKHNLLTYFAGFDEGTTIWSENNVVLMFSMGELNAINLKKKGFDVGYTIPKEGAVGWLDNLTVSAGSPHPEFAYAWINFAFQKKIGADMAVKSGWASTTAPAEGMDYADKLIWAKNPEDYNRRQALWNEVKASN
ncbi:ABC transporter substrate-binding protein [Labrys monachus]|uniref:Spermidine/putrescine transport system substrate-binding protein/spermidine/putrescine transport system substrate-binding protein n=1 Tax=Labrys monachus TaxID=217067 RepID=A0ABU0FNU5_9HYPH|nr:extracellular solute-binding protein [Labrys monachus]MDQ0395700.1 putative spermidine/putrescine transport system substrate-binding protein/spermidine/putrescine transport system substrate-binding protein [Labrys monachus]